MTHGAEIHAYLNERYAGHMNSWPPGWEQGCTIQGNHVTKEGVVVSVSGGGQIGVGTNFSNVIWKQVPV